MKFFSQSKKIALLFIGFLLAMQLFTLVTNAILSYLGISGDFNFESLPKDTISLLLVVVILSPFIETLTQAIPIWIFIKSRFKYAELIIYLLSATLFAVQHYYNIIYMFFTFSMGLILVKAYLKFRKLSKYPYLLTSILHGAHNLIIFIFIQT